MLTVAFLILTFLKTAQPSLAVALQMNPQDGKQELKQWQEAKTLYFQSKAASQKARANANSRQSLC